MIFSPHRHLMLIPSMSCQATCSYCFGPHRGTMMSHALFDDTLDWLESTTPDGQKINLTFHGGEPLLVGLDWYRRNLARLHERFGRRLNLHLQSNLWLLDQAYRDLFKEYQVSLGTSLDGPAHLNDPQRGIGYFARTMNGIETARRDGFNVGVICTFTRLSAPHYQEIFDFFAKEYLPFSVHAVLSAHDNLSLSPNEHADLLINLFDYYLANITHMRIPTFDAMARAISSGQSGLCTFSDCLGGYLTVASDGGIYSCNRLAQPNDDHLAWRLADVRTMPSLDSLAQTLGWQKLRQRELTVQQDCGDCTHFSYCKGGCPYNVLAHQKINDQRDPHCAAYKRFFDHLNQRALAEVFSKENLNAVVNKGIVEHGLLQKGQLLQLIRGTHPQEFVRQAREIVAAVALAVSDSPETAVQKLDQAKLITQRDQAIQSLTMLQNRLHHQVDKLVNLYLHVTYNCNLSCSHCYAYAEPNQKEQSMAVDQIIRLVKEAAQVGFDKVIITGGEPLAHPQRNNLLDALANLRQTVKPMKIVLRTNLAYPLTATLLEKLVHSSDQIVVSVDGNQASHDGRRGLGMYAQTVTNLYTLQSSLPFPANSLLISATLTATEINGAEGAAVRDLGEKMGVPIRFKSILPLGRAITMPLTPEFYIPLEGHAPSGTPRASCGLGMNLYVSPNGECYPCYALTEARYNLGNALSQGLATLLTSARYHALKKVTVDSNQQCQQCALRYLCGGFCRVWNISNKIKPQFFYPLEYEGKTETLAPLDTPPPDCTALHQRARDLLLNALKTLEVSPEQWVAVGLPLPKMPPK